MKIIEKLHKIADQVENETQTGVNTTGDNLSRLAIEAILAGPLQNNGTPTAAWKAYMSEIAKPQNDPQFPAQLDRLTLQDGKKDQLTVRKSCAYIVANAVCGAISTTRTFENVTPDIEL